MGKQASSAVPPPEARPATLAHSSDRELEAVGAEAQRRASDGEAQRAAEQVAADLREIVGDLIARGDVEGLEALLASVQGLASVRSALALARRRVPAP